MTKIGIKMRAAPILFSGKHLYHLFDFNHDEWILFEEGIREYYLNIFDDQYSNIRDRLKTDVETYLRINSKKGDWI